MRTGEPEIRRETISTDSHIYMGTYYLQQHQGQGCDLGRVVVEVAVAVGGDRTWVNAKYKRVG